jgi:hypothetical protein
MRRRTFLIHTGSAAAGMLLLASPALADMPKVQNLSEALAWLDRLEKAATTPRADGTWPLSAVLEHLAQSIEMSMDGFPEPKGALFQATVGSAAFAFFKWRGRMSHGLAEPIPGAPPLHTAATDWKPPAQRLRAAITRFNGYNGPLKPHFAYGALSKADFALAHSFHIANHQDEITAG